MISARIYSTQKLFEAIKNFIPKFSTEKIRFFL